MSTTLTAPTFAHEMTDQELSAVHGGRPRVYYIVDEHGCVIAIVIVEC